MARHPVAWSGPPPPRELASKLVSLGFELGPETSATAARVVHTTRRGDPPRSPFSSAWLWVSKHEVSQQEAIEATRAGAYDVISLGANDALSAIERRLYGMNEPM